MRSLSKLKSQFVGLGVKIRNDDERGSHLSSQIFILLLNPTLYLDPFSSTSRHEQRLLQMKESPGLTAAWENVERESTSHRKPGPPRS
ncbi:hypothetical protein TB2_045959 [Malus domestica]